MYCSFSDQRFDPRADNPYTPAAYSWPSTMPAQAQSELASELSRLVKLLGLKTGIYNVETRWCKNGKPYIMEVSPRGGGNRLAEMLDIVTGSDLIENTVRGAVGMPLLPVKGPEYDGCLAEVILHSDKAGIFTGLEISPEMEAFVIQTDLWVMPGDEVSGFAGANNAIGTLVLRFPDKEKMAEAMADIPAWCKVIAE